MKESKIRWLVKASANTEQDIEDIQGIAERLAGKADTVVVELVCEYTGHDKRVNLHGGKPESLSGGESSVQIASK